MLISVVFLCLFVYGAFNVIPYAFARLRTQANLNKLVAKGGSLRDGGSQPSHDFDRILTQELRSKEIAQLERVFENGYFVDEAGEWRG